MTQVVFFPGYCIDQVYFAYVQGLLIWVNPTTTHLKLFELLDRCLNFRNLPRVSMLCIRLVQIMDQLETQCASIGSLQPYYVNGFFWQYLPFSWTTLRGKHCRHPIVVMGVVVTISNYVTGTFRLDDIPVAKHPWALRRNVHLLECPPG